MRLQKFGHSCLLVEDGGARILIDPGSFSHGFETLHGLTAVLITHQHADHVDVDRLLPLLAANPQARVIADPGSAKVLRDRNIEVLEATAGDEIELGEISATVSGRDHATIHPDIPTVPNVGYLIGGRLFHPGDALTVPERRVEMLALPTAAPWLKLAEAVDYLRAVHPKIAVPIHEAVSAVPQLQYGHFQRLKPEDTELRIIDDGEPVDL